MYVCVNTYILCTCTFQLRAFLEGSRSTAEICMQSLRCLLGWPEARRLELVALRPGQGCASHQSLSVPVDERRSLALVDVGRTDAFVSLDDVAMTCLVMCSVMAGRMDCSA